MNNFDDMNEEGGEFIPVIADGGVPNDYKLDKTEGLLTLALRNVVLMPGVVLPVQLGRAKSKYAAKRTKSQNQPLVVVTQKDAREDEPTKKDLYDIGVVGNVVKILDMPNGQSTAIIQGMRRVMIKDLRVQSNYLESDVVVLEELLPEDEEKREFDAVLDSVKERSEQILKANSGTVPMEAMFALRNIESSVSFINYIVANFPFAVVDKQNMLECGSLKERALMLLTLLNKEMQLASLKQNIREKTNQQIDRQQRNYFLQQQMKSIKEELDENGDDEDYSRLLGESEKKKWNKKVKDVFMKELNKLNRLPQQSLDYSTQVTYLENMLGLPWDVKTKESLSLKTAQEVLDRDHYGMEDIKDRILEHLAVMKLRGNMKSNILCLYGPPGVGKTSLGKSIADALGRNYVRVALGGIHDESEIRGHRRTYVGSMPGRILKAMKEAGSSNPVFILDEIDKVSHADGFHGSPDSALLEVLDPEQNKNFHDNYLDVDYDLSNVMFIATANDISNISQPLKDRMEFINIGGYSQEEKLQIAKRHIVPKVAAELGVSLEEVTFSDDALNKIISGYTMESGVRGLEKQIRKIYRKLAKKIVMKEELKANIEVDDIQEYLGKKEVPHELYEGNDNIGVVTGLSVTSYGGEILFIETSLSKSKTPTLTVTGQIKDVMKESAMLAMQYVKCSADTLGIDPTVFDDTAVHIHVPDGSTPKDGPSAGITMATALASAFTGRKVKANLAMSGEITLRGKVTAVGGIREKTLAAKRSGIKEIILCKDNQKDVEEIKPEYLEGVEFHYVDNVQDVFKLALV